MKFVCDMCGKTVLDLYHVTQYRILFSLGEHFTLSFRRKKYLKEIVCLSCVQTVTALAVGFPNEKRYVDVKLVKIK